jgi:hypothetical protein
MSVAKRFWEGHLLKGGTEVGFANGTISIDRGLLTFYGLGRYDLLARRESKREITGTIEHGFIDVATFATGAFGLFAAGPFTFDISASMSDNAIVLSGCSIETYDLTLPADGWITETINWRAKSVKSY